MNEVGFVRGFFDGSLPVGTTHGSMRIAELNGGRAIEVGKDIIATVDDGGFMSVHKGHLLNSGVDSGVAYGTVSRYASVGVVTTDEAPKRDIGDVSKTACTNCGSDGLVDGYCVGCCTQNKTAQAERGYEVWGNYGGDEDILTHIKNSDDAVNYATLALTEHMTGGCLLPDFTWVKEIGYSGAIIWTSRGGWKTAQLDVSTENDFYTPPCPECDEGILKPMDDGDEPLESFRDPDFDHFTCDECGAVVGAKTAALDPRDEDYSIEDNGGGSCTWCGSEDTSVTFQNKGNGMYSCRCNSCGRTFSTDTLPEKTAQFPTNVVFDAPTDDYAGLTFTSPIEDVKRVLTKLCIDNNITTLQGLATALFTIVPYDDEVYESIAHAGLDSSVVLQECIDAAQGKTAAFSVRPVRDGYFSVVDRTGYTVATNLPQHVAQAEAERLSIEEASTAASGEADSVLPTNDADLDTDLLLADQPVVGEDYVLPSVTAQIDPDNFWGTIKSASAKPVVRPESDWKCSMCGTSNQRVAKCTLCDTEKTAQQMTPNSRRVGMVETGLPYKGYEIVVMEYVDDTSFTGRRMTSYEWSVMDDEGTVETGDALSVKQAIADAKKYIDFDAPFRRASKDSKWYCKKCGETTAVPKNKPVLDGSWTATSIVCGKCGGRVSGKKNAQTTGFTTFLSAGGSSEAINSYSTLEEAIANADKDIWSVYDYSTSSQSLPVGYITDPSGKTVANIHGNAYGLSVVKESQTLGMKTIFSIIDPMGSPMLSADDSNNTIAKTFMEARAAGKTNLLHTSITTSPEGDEFLLYEYAGKWFVMQVTIPRGALGAMGYVAVYENEAQANSSFEHMSRTAQADTYTDGEGYTWSMLGINDAGGGHAWRRDDGAQAWFEVLTYTVVNKSGDRKVFNRGDFSELDLLNAASYNLARWNQVTAQSAFDQLWRSEQSPNAGLCKECADSPANDGVCHGLYGNLVYDEETQKSVTTECFEYRPANKTAQKEDCPTCNGKGCSDCMEDEDSREARLKSAYDYEDMVAEFTCPSCHAPVFEDSEVWWDERSYLFNPELDDPAEGARGYKCDQCGDEGRWDALEPIHQAASKTASTGTVTDIVDSGSIVQIFIDGTPYAGDGNLTRAALADSGLGVGDLIEYESEYWGGLAWFAPAGDSSYVEVNPIEDVTYHTGSKTASMGCGAPIKKFTPNGREYTITCGQFTGGENRFCPSCEAKFERDYPQGWQSYPGDICPHGNYTGGSGADFMCGQCESE